MTENEVYNFLWVTHKAINVKKFCEKAKVSYSNLTKFRMTYKQNITTKGTPVKVQSLSEDELIKIYKTAKLYGYKRQQN